MHAYTQHVVSTYQPELPMNHNSFAVEHDHNEWQPLAWYTLVLDMVGNNEEFTVLAECK